MYNNDNKAKIQTKKERIRIHREKEQARRVPRALGGTKMVFKDPRKKEE